MASRVLQDWIKSYLKYTTALEAPDTFHFWAAVSTIAGALRRCVWLDMGHFQWTPNFYIVFVAPPGIVSKTSTLSIGMSLLAKVKDIKFGPDATTWQALTASLAGSRLDVPMGNGDFLAMSAVTIFSSEFGAFLDPRNREMIDVLVDLWDNRTGTWEKTTKTSGNDQVVNPWINIAACTTPAWIAGNFPDYMVGGGFTSRCVFVYADKKRRLSPYPFLEIEVEGFKKMQEDLLTDLQQISRMRGAFTLSQSAIEYGIQWYRDHYNNLNKELNTNQFAGYLARKQTHVHKLAMVLSAAESDTLTIEKHHLENSAAIITSLEADMPRVFSHIGQQGDARNTSTLLDIIKIYVKVDKRALYRLVSSKMGLQEFDNAIAGAIATGYVKAYTDGEKVYYIYEPDTPPAKGNGQMSNSV